MKKSSWYILGAVVLATAGSGYWWYATNGTAAVQYKTAKIERGNLQSTVSASGTVNPVTQVSVGTQVSGQLKEVLVDFNSPVRAGQLIAMIDPETFEYRVRSAQADVDSAKAQVLTAQANISSSKAQLSRAQMDLEEAKRDLARKESLVAQQFIAQSEADKARATVNLAGESVKGAMAQLAVTEAQVKSVQATVAQRESTLAQARIDLERTKIKSPVNGIVIKRSVERGQTVAASLQSPELFVIAQNLSDMQVDASIDESDIGRVRAGQKATFTVDAFAGQMFEGEVKQVRNAAQTVANVVTYTAVIGFSNANGRLLPGMTANVRVITDSRESVLKIPNTALRMRIAGVEPAPAASTPRAGVSGGASGAAMSGANSGATNGATTSVLGALSSTVTITGQQDQGWTNTLVSWLIKDAYAQGLGGGGGLRERLTEQLQLTEPQQTKLDAVLAQFRPQLMALRELPEDQRQVERDKIMVPMRAAINAFLTPEQKTKYAQLQAAQTGRSGQAGGGAAGSPSATSQGSPAQPSARKSSSAATSSSPASQGAGGGKLSTPSGSALAAPPTAPGTGGGGGPLAALRGRLIAELGLTAAQTDGVDAIMGELRPKMAGLRELPEADRAKARERVLGDMRAQIGDLLTPAQKAKYQVLLAELANRQQTRGRVYVLGADGKPKALAVRLGISDGTYTELITGPNNTELTEGSEVIVGLAQPAGASVGSTPSGGAPRSAGPRLPF